MKTTKLLFTLLALLGMTQAAAQEYEYVPFVREGVKWTYSIDDYRFFEDYETNPARGDNKVYRTLEIKGDTVINGKTYKAMHMCTDDVYSEPKDVVPIYLREENKMVYGIVPDGKIYGDAPIGDFSTYHCRWTPLRWADIMSSVYLMNAKREITSRSSKASALWA